MKASEVREKTREELIDQLNGMYQELFNLRTRRGVQNLPNPLRLRILRRSIAEIKTVLREDELGIRKLLDSGAAKTKSK